MAPDTRDEKQDDRIAAVERSVDKLEIRFDAAEEKADDRHTRVMGTVTNTRTAIDDMRKADEDERKAAAERREAALAREAEKEKLAAAERAAVFSSPKTWAAIFVLLFLVFAPDSAPKLLDFGAQLMGLDTHKQAPELAEPAD